MITFGSWFRTQTNRTDEVGCLATQVYNDACMPFQADYTTAVKHIKEVHQDRLIEDSLMVHIEAAKDAYGAYVRTLST